MASPLIHVRVSEKIFSAKERRVTALKNIALDIVSGEFVLLIGPSGCGKSTLLRLIAGLDTEYNGRVEVRGHKIAGPGTDRGVVFQEPRLFPWLDVSENISAGFNSNAAETRQRVSELIKLVRLTGFEKAYPKQLSGGMAQRTAIARALYRNPGILLLDEPFSALDAFTRAHLQTALLDVWKQRRTTSIFVTHDIDEAVMLATKIVVMDARPGTIRNIIPVDLPYPRNRLSSEFERKRHEVLAELQHAYNISQEVEA